MNNNDKDMYAGDMEVKHILEFTPEERQYLNDRYDLGLPEDMLYGDVIDDN